MISGDTLVDFGHGLQIGEQVAGGLRPLLALPVELVLPTHGARLIG